MRRILGNKGPSLRGLLDLLSFGFTSRFALAAHALVNISSSVARRAASEPYRLVVVGLPSKGHRTVKKQGGNEHIRYGRVSVPTVSLKPLYASKI